MVQFLILFLVVDAVVTVGVLAFVRRRQKAQSAKLATTLRTVTTRTAPAMFTTRTSAPAVTSAAPMTTTALITPITTAAAGATGATGATAETGSLTRMFGRGELRGVATFAAEQNERIREYVRGNWSGVHDELPSVLATLLVELERDAQAKGLLLDRETLKMMLITALRAHRIGNGSEVREALDKVA
jgi:hypothetical protein